MISTSPRSAQWSSTDSAAQSGGESLKDLPQTWAPRFLHHHHLLTWTCIWILICTILIISLSSIFLRTIHPYHHHHHQNHNYVNQEQSKPVSGQEGVSSSWFRQQQPQKKQAKCKKHKIATPGLLYHTRSLWALRARLLVGGPSGLLTHYPTLG